jgi:prepilin-type N-terminal cleavage/methylation domain-containing protein
MRGYTVIRTLLRKNLITAQRGYTVIELLLVIAIILVLGVAATPFLSRFYLQTNLDTTEQILVSSIRKAQSYSMDGKDGLPWGVCLTGGAIRVFETSCASPTIKEDYTIPTTISISGLSTITFSSSRGEPSATISATVSSQIGTHSVQINTAGALTIN